MSIAHQFFDVFGVVAIVYFVALNGIYLVFTAIAWRDLTRHLRSHSYVVADDSLRSPLIPAISVLLPAYNEESGVVGSVHSLLALRYPEHEVVVINDGSTDQTLELLRREFDLVPARLALRDTLGHAPVQGAYLSRRNPKLMVIDKENGGKADALNCGIVAASHPYVCSIDGDSLIEDDALLSVARPILEDPDLVVATGGIIRIANGCEIEAGRVIEVDLPRSRLATLQVVEYFRAFLVGRVAWSRIDALLIISGAFGVFKRSIVEAAGGYWTETVGEDAELVVRMHRYLREHDTPYRVEFVADPVCWTEVPEDFRTLERQRRRWQRGLGETLWRHRRAIANPRYGALGTLAMPFFAVFEFIGPLIAAASFVALPIAAALGVFDLQLFVEFLVAAVALGVLLSVAALALEEFSFRRHARHRDAARLLLYAVIDNLGYRQVTDVYRTLGVIDFLRGRKDWGEMKRVGLGDRRNIETAGARSAGQTQEKEPAIRA